MKIKLRVLLAVFSLGFSTGLFAQTQASSLEDINFTSIRRTIVGDKANFLMKALLKAGVYDTRALVGTMNLEVQYVRCTEPVVLNPVPSCLLSFNDDILITNADLSRSMFSMLRENGLNRKGKLGVRNVVVTNLRCRRAVIPQAKGRCSYELYL